MKPVILYKHFDEDFVNKFLTLAESADYYKGHVQVEPGQPTRYMPDARQVDCYDVDDQSLRDTLFELAQEHNDGMDITHTGEVVLLRYRPGGKFVWHSDILEGDPQRKLTLVVQLSEPETYEGGQLNIKKCSTEPFTHSGSVVIFPSNISHRVTPVTEGVRYSLITWIYGPERELDKDWH